MYRLSINNKEPSKPLNYTAMYTRLLQERKVGLIFGSDQVRIRLGSSSDQARFKFGSDFDLFDLSIHFICHLIANRHGVSSANMSSTLSSNPESAI